MTYGQVRARLTQMAPGTPLDLLDGWIQDRYAELLDRLSWRRLDQVTTLTTAAEYATGTVAVTNGSAAVVGTGTTFTAAMVGRMFRITGQADYYTISAFTDATHITLERAYSGTTATGAAYRINQAVYSFGSDVRLVHSLQSFQFEAPVPMLSREEMDAQDPARTAYGAPVSWCWSFDLSSDPPEITVELNPVPTEAKSFKVAMSVEAVPLGGGTGVTVLPWVRPGALVEGVMADIRRHEKDLAGSRDYELRFDSLAQTMIRVACEQQGAVDLRMAPRFRDSRREFRQRRGM